MTMPAILAFGTKAETLSRLAPRLTRSYVMPLVSFLVPSWRSDRQGTLGKIREKLGTGLLVARSSAASEDGVRSSKAGAYTSILGVDGASADAVGAAIDEVIASYDGSDPLDQVLVQPQLGSVRLSGVLFSRELTTLAPYYVFNYDRSRSTDAVTSGRSADLETYVRFRKATEPLPNPELAAVFAAVAEVETLLGSVLEMELAVDGDGKVCLFQARPITTATKSALPDEAAVNDWLIKVSKKVEKLSRPHPHLHGSRSVFGVMPDWNPAEIIGLKPRALALSLYKELITDSIWAYMRDNYGYRNLRSFPLLISLLGVPYIDVRVSFNSFVPKGVSEELSRKLINYYVERLVAAPHAHDKVEFDIVFSCYYPGITKELAKLKDHGFTDAELTEILGALRTLTNRIVHPTGFWKDDLAKVETLKSRQQQVLGSPMSSVDKIYWLIEDCKRYGTLPFSGLARAGFIAVQFLKGLVKQGIFSPEDYDAYLGSLDTVTNRMSADVSKLATGELASAMFLADYGHLRPGTYDIRSPRYDEDFERYFASGQPRSAHVARPAFHLEAAKEKQVDALLEAEGLEINAKELFAFIRSGIEGREYTKLVFTRSLSDAMVELEKVGRQCKLDREELSHLDIKIALGLYASLDAQDLREVLLRNIEANRAAHEITQIVKLPDLILSPADVFHFHAGKSEPNFITLGKVRAEVVREDELSTVSLAGKAVCVRSADPGFDWFFSRGIGALVTQFGGANSHMAIRAAEQGVPAVIGCGEQNFEAWSQARQLDIDCANRTVIVVQ